jgi:quercetin dioxygenase-like cupin family protein
MRNFFVGLNAGAVAGLCLGGVMLATAPAQADPITRTEIFRGPLEGVQGMDEVAWVTDFEPGAAAPRHTHPGYEFNYVLKGSVVFEPDGQKPFTLKAGQVTLNQRGHFHKVWNASTTEPAQLMVVLVHEEGKPIVTLPPEK